jgi:dolichol kinase
MVKLQFFNLISVNNLVFYLFLRHFNPFRSFIHVFLKFIIFFYKIDIFIIENKQTKNINKLWPCCLFDLSNKIEREGEREREREMRV